MRVTMTPVVIGFAWNGPQYLGKKTGRVGNRMTHHDHQK